MPCRRKPKAADLPTLLARLKRATDARRHKEANRLHAQIVPLRCKQLEQEIRADKRAR